MSLHCSRKTDANKKTIKHLNEINIDNSWWNMHLKAYNLQLYNIRSITKIDQYKTSL